MKSTELRENNVVYMFHPEKGWIMTALSLEKMKSIRDIPSDRYFKPIPLKEFEISFYIETGNCEYLHQLQNYYYYVNGVELNVDIKNKRIDVEIQEPISESFKNSIDN